MRKLIRFIQNLSLDITMGSIVMTLFVAEILEVNITLSMVIGLAIAIWLIYTGDHLLDAYKSKESVSNPRHAFHQRYFKALLPISAFVFVLGLWNITYLPLRTIEIGGILALLSLVYLLYSYHSKRGVNKEFFAAIVYAVGVCVAPASILQGNSMEIIGLIIILTLIAYSNLLIISIFEESVDRTDMVKSVAIRKDVNRTVKLAYAMLVLAFVITFVFLLSNNLDHAYSLLLVMIAILFFTIRMRAKTLEIYRVLCDGIFLIPIIYLL